MNNKINFLNDPWFWPVIIVGVILLCIFLWKEYTLSGSRRILLKVILSVLAVIALACIALKPVIPTSDTSGKIILLTPGYEREDLDSLRKTHSAIKVLDYKDPELDFPYIQNAEAVYILGNGVPQYELYRFEKIPAIYIPGTSPTGVVKVRFSEKNVVGDDLKIQGLYNSSHAGHRLILQAPGGEGLDSVVLNGGDKQPFQLRSELKVAGEFVYNLIEKNDEGKVLTNDPVPVQVQEKMGLRVLIINNFPTFETKYLKNFLAEAGHEVVVRSQITSGRFKYEYFNTNRKIIGNFSRETLEGYDLLIVDAATVRALEKSQSAGLSNAIRLDGLGVFIQPDENFFISPGDLVNLKFKRQRNDELSLDDWPEINFSVFPFVFDLSPGFENIHTSGNSAISGYMRNGMGRIGTSVLSNTFELFLEGNPEVYKEIWTELIEQLSKRENVPAQLEQLEQFVFQNEPYHFTIRTQSPPPVITNNERVIPLAQDVNLPEYWKGRVWPREKGWSQFKEDTTRVYHYYVSENGSWSSLISQKTIKNNLRYFDRRVEGGEGTLPLEPINPLWFYGLFLICMGSLWLEPKLT